jgi:hypothetical protein
MNEGVLNFVTKKFRAGGVSLSRKKLINALPRDGKWLIRKREMEA